MPRCAIYARVSTADQSSEMQLSDLAGYAAERGFDVVGQYVDEGVSGAKIDRPKLAHLMEDARKGRFDLVLVWKFDRFSRSVIHLVNTLEAFQQLGVDFISLRDGQDTTTPQGKLLFHVNAAFAEFERGLISERVRAGMKAAKARGVHCGRASLDDRARRQAEGLRCQGISYRDIAEKMGISVGTAVKYTKAIDAYCRHDGRKKVEKATFAEQWAAQEGPDAQEQVVETEALFIGRQG